MYIIFFLSLSFHSFLYSFSTHKKKRICKRFVLKLNSISVSCVCLLFYSIATLAVCVSHSNRSYCKSSSFVSLALLNTKSCLIFCVYATNTRFCIQYHSIFRLKSRENAIAFTFSYNDFLSLSLFLSFFISLYSISISWKVLFCLFYFLFGRITFHCRIR